jgi:excisionase family DNA binding protein
MTPAAPSPWFTADEAARYLRLPSRRALYKRVERRQVRAHRWGRQLRFHRRDLDALLGSASVSAVAEEGLG